jgi:hypothetical protein
VSENEHNLIPDSGLSRSLDIFLELFTILPGVGTFEDLVDLLESESFGLDREEVDNNDLEQIPEQEDQVDFPFEPIKGNGHPKSIDQRCDIGNNAQESEAFSPGFVSQDLCGIKRLHGCPSEGENDHKQEDKCDTGVCPSCTSCGAKKSTDDGQDHCNCGSGEKEDSSAPETVNNE